MPTIPEAIQTALQHHNAGRFAQAQAIYRQVLQLSPGHPDAWHLLGLIAYQTGQHETAIDHIQRAIAENPNVASFHNSLGSALQAQGKLEQAVQTFQHALRLKPDYAEAHYNLGNALMLQEKIHEAAASYGRAVALKSDYAEAHSNHGNALKALGKNREAIDCYERALSLRPNYAEAHSNLASVLLNLSRIDEAEASLRRALENNPNFARAHANLAGVFQAQGKLNDAIEHYERALQIDPDYAMPYQQLGGLAVHGHYELSPAQLNHINDLLAGNRVSLDDRRALHSTLAVLADDAQNYDQAFEHYRQVNQLRRQVLRQRRVEFDQQKHQQLVDDLIATFTPEYFHRVQSFGSDSQLPVFVVGMVRSGTTLVEQILASHPQVFGAGELKEIGQMATRMSGNFQLSASYPRCMSDIGQDVIQKMAQQYLDRISALDPDAMRVVDKMPANHNSLGFIATLFPRARVIHCRRDPRDVCLSAFFQDFESDLAAAMSCSLENLAFYYRQYEKLMAHWRKVLPQDIFDIQYEDLVRNQESQSQELVVHCGLQWDDRCLKFHETSRPIQTASKLQVRRQIYTSSIGRWKKYEAQLRLLLELLATCD